VRSSPRKIAVDTGVFVALLSRRDSFNRICQEALNKLPETTELYTTEACLVETSFLLPSRSDVRERWRSLIQLLQINIVHLDLDGFGRVFDLLDKYQDLPMDFADATLVVACERLNVTRVFTIDFNDFELYRPRHCQRFELLPAS
jgi:uncharacterized protein